MTRDEVKKVMAAVLILWPNSSTAPRGFEALAVDVWMNMIGDLDADSVLAALQIIATTPDTAFAPPVGIIRERTLDVIADASGTRLLSAGEAWAEVRDRVARVGRSGVPVFSQDAVINAVDSMGWRSICDSTNEAASWAHFRRVYETYAGRQQRRDTMPPNVASVINELAQRHLALANGEDHAR